MKLVAGYAVGRTERDPFGVGPRDLPVEYAEVLGAWILASYEIPLLALRAPIQPLSARFCGSNSVGGISGCVYPGSVSGEHRVEDGEQFSPAGDELGLTQSTAARGNHRLINASGRFSQLLRRGRTVSTGTYASFFF